MTADPAAFVSLHNRGFVRVAAASPRVATADPGTNAERTIALAERACAEGCDLVVFPELGLSGYAIDDLLLQDALLDAAEAAIARVAEASAECGAALVVGAPLRRNGRLYNAAVAIAAGRVLGVVPKSFLPNYREYYEKRWFASGAGLSGLSVAIAGREVPFGTDLIFEGDADFRFAAEICEDFWAPAPPSTQAALAGATILCNLSASNITVGKAADRALLCASQSMRAVSAYIYAAAGAGESTTDLAWDGQGSVHELGALLAEAERFPAEASLTIADVDLERIRLERLRTGTFNDAARNADHPETRFRTIAFDRRIKEGDLGLRRPNRRFPFVPNNPAHLDQDCFEAFNIQVAGLVRRIEATNPQSLVLGISGGLDSTHALIVAAKACDRLGLPRAAIRGYTMPGLATGERSKASAWALMRAFGCTAEEIDIRPAADRMLADLDHPAARGDSVYDVTYENVQAGLRTDYLFRLANRHDGFVIGTGDLSELALGWCTYGVGDQMSHYAVNSGVPKTLIQHLIRWAATTKQFDIDISRVLLDVLGSEISPELVPAHDGVAQSTEAAIGPYALADFFLFHILRYGLKPSKVAFLAWHAWRDPEVGAWPLGFPDDKRVAYDLPTIRRWLASFLRRFFETSQFKRSAMPNGPKVLAGGALSPRGDWRAPSDAVAAAWIAELEANVPESLR